MKPKPLPSQEYLREALDYNPETGVLRWQYRPREHFSGEHAWRTFNGQFAHRIVGSRLFHKDGSKHYGMMMDRTPFIASRIIWKMMTGQDPMMEIDHINRDPFDNSWKNLRDISKSRNCVNRGPKRY